MSTNFDFSLKEYLVSENVETTVFFSYLLSGYINKDFLVKPLIGNGTVEIFNSEKNEWIGSFSSTNSFPKISESMLVRFQNLIVDKTYLWFEIKNVKDGSTYFTPKKYIWGEKTYYGYVEEINYSLLNQTNPAKEINSDVIEVTETSAASQSSYLGFMESIPKKYYMYFSVLVFIVSAVFGFLYRKRENKKEMIQSISEDFKRLGSCDINDAPYICSVVSSWERNQTINIW